MVEIAVTGILLDSLWHVTVSRELPPEATRVMLRELEGIERGLDPLAEAFRHDARGIREPLAATYREGPRAVASMVDGPISPPSREGRILGVVLWGSGFFTGSTEAGTVRNIETCYARIIDALEEPYGSGAVAAACAPFGGTSLTHGQLLRVRDPVGRLWASLLFPGLDRVQEKDESRRLRLRLARTYLAVRLFRQERGRLPRELGELVPAYLGALLTDPFAEGKPVRLRADPDGTWVVYGVGRDGVDDGGDAGGAMAHRPPRSEAPAEVGGTAAYTDMGFAGQRETPPPNRSGVEPVRDHPSIPRAEPG
jgi:hypothetical protein